MQTPREMYRNLGTFHKGGGFSKALLFSTVRLHTSKENQKKSSFIDTSMKICIVCGGSMSNKMLCCLWA